MDELEDNKIETFRGDKAIHVNPFITTCFGAKEPRTTNILKMAIIWQKWRGIYSHKACTHGKNYILTKN